MVMLHQIRSSRFVVVLGLILLLCSCSNITRDNYQRIKNGMPKSQVVSMLGNPSQSSSIQFKGVSAVSLQWISGSVKINIILIDNKVALKSFNDSKNKNADLSI